MIEYNCKGGKNLLHTELFFKSNNCFGPVRILVKNSTIFFESEKTLFDCEMLRSIIQFANTINQKKYPSKMPVYFSFNQKVQFSDKLTYVLFECICYQLILEGHPVYVSINHNHKITTHGYNSSPLWLLSTGKKSDVAKFLEKFQHDLYKLHFRKVLLKDSGKDELCKLMDDIAIFQKPFDIKEEDREKIAEVLVELVGNAKEHSSGDCLIDFDISEEYFKRGIEGKMYHGINIAILNFSGQLLNTSLKQKLNFNENQSERYNLVRQAYNYHQPYFNEQYLEEDFYNIATFQHKISGRRGNTSTGGTGLTKLIRSLEETSDAYMCYVVSGQRRLQFKKEYMQYNEDYWIGFNNANDFLTAPPNPNLLNRNPFFFPGTAYNLNFIMEVMKYGE